jgi:hypothetical protein
MNSVPGLLAELGMSQLASLCQQVADDGSIDSATADKAWQLKRKWVELVGRETPPEPNLKTHEATQAELAALKNQMIELLATIV